MEKTQRNLLFNILEKNNGTRFGTEHDFPSITSIADFRAKVPVREYDAYVHYISSIRSGESGVLTTEPVKKLEPTGGSTAASKFIPYTRGLREEFQQGIAPWIVNLFTRRTKIMAGSAYWSITPAVHIESGGKVPVGFEDDTEYFGPVGRYLLTSIFSVPREVSRIKDMEAFRYVTLLFLLKDRLLAFISIWNPTFLTILLKPVYEWRDSLIQDIKCGTITPPVEICPILRKRLQRNLRRDRRRSDELKAMFTRRNSEMLSTEASSSIFEEIWPNLGLISCWADGHAANQVGELKILFPNVEIQPKGLLATEGFVSFPLVGEEGAALSVNSHFFEFVTTDDEGEPEEKRESDTRLAHQLERGKHYSVIITTGGGLYRYDLGDIIKVTGFVKQCPLIRFVGRKSRISDLFGEKLNEYHVATVLRDVLDEFFLSPSFFMVAPEKSSESGEYFYALFLQLPQESPDVPFHALAENIDNRLKENFHYRYCRNLGQLSGFRVFRIDASSNAAARYVDVCRVRGQRLGDIKPSILHKGEGWSNEFCGSFVGGGR